MAAPSNSTNNFLSPITDCFSGFAQFVISNAPKVPNFLSSQVSGLKNSVSNKFSDPQNPYLKEAVKASQTARNFINEKTQEKLTPKVLSQAIYNLALKTLKVVPKGNSEFNTKIALNSCEFLKKLEIEFEKLNPHKQENELNGEMKPWYKKVDQIRSVAYSFSGHVLKTTFGVAAATAINYSLMPFFSSSLMLTSGFVATYPLYQYLTTRYGSGLSEKQIEIINNQIPRPSSERQNEHDKRNFALGQNKWNEETYKEFQKQLHSLTENDLLELVYNPDFKIETDKDRAKKGVWQGVLNAQKAHFEAENNKKLKDDKKLDIKVSFQKEHFEYAKIYDLNNIKKIMEKYHDTFYRLKELTKDDNDEDYHPKTELLNLKKKNYEEVYSACWKSGMYDEYQFWAKEYCKIETELVDHKRSQWIIKEKPNQMSIKNKDKEVEKEKAKISMKKHTLILNYYAKVGTFSEWKKALYKLQKAQIKADPDHRCDFEIQTQEDLIKRLKQQPAYVNGMLRSELLHAEMKKYDIEISRLDPDACLAKQKEKWEFVKNQATERDGTSHLQAVAQLNLNCLNAERPDACQGDIDKIEDSLLKFRLAIEFYMGSKDSKNAHPFLFSYYSYLKLLKEEDEIKYNELMDPFKETLHCHMNTLKNKLDPNVESNNDELNKLIKESNDLFIDVKAIIEKRDS